MSLQDKMHAIMRRGWTIRYWYDEGLDAYAIRISSIRENLHVQRFYTRREYLQLEKPEVMEDFLVVMMEDLEYMIVDGGAK